MNQVCPKCHSSDNLAVGQFALECLFCKWHHSHDNKIEDIYPINISGIIKEMKEQGKLPSYFTWKGNKNGQF
jgi:hypothetical protein